MKKLLTIIIALLAISGARAQGYIITDMGDTISCYIIDINGKSVTYQTVKNGKARNQTIDRELVTKFVFDTMPDLESKISRVPEKYGNRFSAGAGAAVRGSLSGKAVSGGGSVMCELGGYFNEKNGMAANFRGDLFGDGYCVFIGPTYIYRSKMERGNTLTAFAGLGFNALKYCLSREDISPTRSSGTRQGTILGLTGGCGLEFPMNGGCSWGAGVGLDITNRGGSAYPDETPYYMVSANLRLYIVFGRRK